MIREDITVVSREDILAGMSSEDIWIEFRKRNRIDQGSILDGTVL